MSVADEISLLQTNLSNAYDAIEGKGGTVPEQKNTANLATAIESISGGGGGSDIITPEDATRLGYSEEDTAMLNAGLTEAIAPAVDDEYNNPANWELTGGTELKWIYKDTSTGIDYNVAVASVKYLPWKDLTNKSGATYSSPPTGYNFVDFRSLITIPSYNFSTFVSSAYLFKNCVSLIWLPPDLDFSAVIKANNMFNGCYSLKEIDLHSIITLTDANSMFTSCWSLTKVDLSGLTTLSSAPNMFSGCHSLAHLDLSSLDPTNITAYTDMFLNVHRNCHIIVKDQVAKDWFATNFAGFTNVTIKGEES